MTHISPIPFAHHLIVPPMDLPFGLRSGRSIFAAERDGADYYRPHEGIDLYPKDSSPPHPDSVYAVNWGTVEELRNHSATPPSDWEIVIRHHPHSSGVYTLYRHLISLEPGIAVGIEVEAGERIGRIDGNLPEPHVHFLWSRATDHTDPFRAPATGGTGTIVNRIPLDATPLLYRFEAYRWHVRGANVHRYEHDNSYPYSKIERIRAISWRGKSGAAGTWLFQVAMPHHDSNAADESALFFLPINDSLPHERLMVDILRDAFNNGNKVRLRWHDSYFYGNHKWMIHDVRVRP